MSDNTVNTKPSKENILLYKKYKEKYFERIRKLHDEIWEDLKKDDLVSPYKILSYTSLEEMEYELRDALLGWGTDPSTI